MAGNKRVFNHGKQHGKQHGASKTAASAAGTPERVEGPAPREDVLEMDGEVIKILGFGNYSVKINELDLVVNVSLAGKMKKFNISVILGDKVKVELNPHDPTIGRIVYRYK